MSTPASYSRGPAIASTSPKTLLVFVVGISMSVSVYCLRSGHGHFHILSESSFIVLPFGATLSELVVQSLNKQRHSEDLYWTDVTHYRVQGLAVAYTLRDLCLV